MVLGEPSLPLPRPGTKLVSGEPYTHERPLGSPLYQEAQVLTAAAGCHVDSVTPPCSFAI